MKSFKKVFYTIVIISFFPNHAGASQDFSSWLADLKQEAQKEGISENIIAASLNDIQPIPRVIELDRKQPEGTMTFAKYRERVINQNRIDKGRRLLAQYSNELNQASQKYGVPPQYIVALWGIETSYGENTGGFKVIDSLATLAYDGRRSDFFRKELINALKILDAGHITPANMKGSWAGAMGQNQFMPSSFHTFAVDGNGDGHKDIWTTKADVFASTANYLSQSGWKEDEKWGRAIKLPQGFPESLTGTKTSKPLSFWKGTGITLPNNSSIPTTPNLQASVVTPDGLGGPAFLVYDNYNVILKWNRSTYFATSVGLLADAIAQ